CMLSTCATFCLRVASAVSSSECEITSPFLKLRARSAATRANSASASAERSCACSEETSNCTSTSPFCTDEPFSNFTCSTVPGNSIASIAPWTGATVPTADNSGAQFSSCADALVTVVGGIGGCPLLIIVKNCKPVIPPIDRKNPRQ